MTLLLNILREGQVSIYSRILVYEEVVISHVNRMSTKGTLPISRYFQACDSLSFPTAHLFPETGEMQEQVKLIVLLFKFLGA